jgi:homoserine kinase type II
LELADDRQCDWVFKNNFNLMSEMLDYTVSFDVRFQGMPEIPIHCDYHPGNLKFNDDKGLGIFDFDWSKIDYRLLDVALCRVYFTSLWNDKAVGRIPDNFSLFLSTCKQACHRLEHISPLTEQEHNP